MKRSGRTPVPLSSASPEIVPEFDGPSLVLGPFMTGMSAIVGIGVAEIYAFFAVFARVGAIVGLLPGFGEQMIPARVRLVAALAFAVVVWPIVLASHSPVGAFASGPGLAPFGLGGLIVTETAVGLAIGVSVRFFVLALQLAGSMAAQATSVSQIFGAGATPDPLPALGNMLTLSGIALALAADLHLKAAMLIVASYEVMPFGVFPVAGDLGEWGLSRAASAFALAFTIASPFVVASLLYNLALGAINRAMPQLMVAFIGAPAITAGALFILFIVAPVALIYWKGRLDEALAAPFGVF